MTLQKTREKFTGFDGVETCESETPQGYSVSWSKTNQRTIDANGSISSDNMYSYVYDAENRLVQVNFLNPQPPTKPDTVQMTYDGLGHRATITELHGNTIISSKSLLWVGPVLSQERDSTGQTVTKQFFDNGEQINGTNYYYAKDHLQSVRELTDSNGVVQANYDYDGFGRQLKLSGSMDSGFGYAQFYVEKTLCLDLTWFRAYDPEKGRWLSRDPAGESVDHNVYDYVKNHTFVSVDVMGLCPSPDCGDQPPMQSSNDNPYSSSASYCTINANYMYQYGGDNQWGQCVRSCLLCEMALGASMEAAHMYCYWHAALHHPFVAPWGLGVAIVNAALYWPLNLAVGAAGGNNAPPQVNQNPPNSCSTK